MEILMQIISVFILFVLVLLGLFFAVKTIYSLIDSKQKEKIDKRDYDG